MAESSPNWVENNVGKGEIARYEQFLLFSQCFQKTCTADTKKAGLVWDRVNSVPRDKVLDWTKQKEFVDDKSDVIEKLNLCSKC